MIEVNNKIDIKSLTPDELKELFQRKGQPGYRAGQTFKWLSGGCSDWSEMTSLPASLRAARIIHPRP